MQEHRVAVTKPHMSKAILQIISKYLIVEMNIAYVV
jgi:hypothetical protein